MAEDADRRAELLGAAVGGDLTGDERAELDALLAHDPSAAAELAELRGTLDRLPPAGSGWDDAAPPPGLADRIRAATADAEVPRIDAARPGRRAVRSRVLAGAVAAGFAGLGVGGTLLGQVLTDRPVTGPPGTLGAVERITFDGEPAGVEVDAALVAHTWGTETVLDVAGLPAGETYRVVLVDDGGEERPAGAFLGSEVPVECRLNAAVLRPDAVRVEIRDAQERTVMTSTLPAAGA